jgi:DNA-directed RNA polymerase I, II, and III subunit RPABC2
MSDSEDNNINKIFMTTKMHSSSGKTKIVPNTAQNMYINGTDLLKNTSKSKKTTSHLQNLRGGSNGGSINSNGGKEVNLQKPKKKLDKLSEKSDNEESDSDNSENSESDDSTISDAEDQEQEDELDPNEEPIDSDVEEVSSNIDAISDEEEDDEEPEEEEKEYEDVEDNENEIAYDGNNNDDCLYQYDDLADERDTERQPIQIPNSERTTDPEMTHYEKIRLLGIRTKQILMGAKVMVKYNGNLGATELAKYELNNKTTPLVIKRPLPDNTFELWKVSELNISDNDNTQLIEELNESFNQNENLYEIA